ncbi:MAG: NAD-binding protein [Halanaeroarchaeum sp.]
MTRDTLRQTVDVSPRPGVETFVVGGGHLGHDIARRLVAKGRSVTVIGSTPMADPPPNLEVEHVDVLDETALLPIGLSDDPTVLAVTGSDSTNLLVAQLARVTYDAERVLVRVNDPRRASAFHALGVEVVNASATLGRIIAEERL